MSRRALLADLLVFVVALALRLFYVHQNADVIGLDVSQLSQTDNYVFAQWAAGIANGDVLCREQPHAYHLWTRDVAPEDRWLEWYGGRETYHQAPLYPYVVAGIYALFGRGWETVGYAQAVLGALTCVLTGILARRLISLRAGLIAGLLLAFMGQFYFYDAFLLRDGFMALVVVLLALALERAVSRGRKLDWLLAGGALGLLTLAKETGIPMLLLTLALLAWFWRRQPRRLALAGVLLLAGWGAVTAPAFARNRIVGAPTFKLSTRGPEVFVTGNARGQDGVGWDPPTAELRQILMDSNFSLSRTILLTLATHRADPLGFPKLLWRKTAAFFNAYEVPNNVDFYLFEAHLTSLRVGFVAWWFLAPAALLGLLLGLPRKRELAVPYLLFLAITVSVVALYVLGRFRVQLLPLVAFFAALTLDWAWRTLRARRPFALLLAAVPFAVLVAWTAVPEGTPTYNEANRDTAIMLQLAKAGRFEQAMHFYRHLEARYAAPDVVQDLETRRKLGAIQDAFRDFELALRWPEESAERHLWLGRGYAGLTTASKRGELIELSDLAREHFDQALALQPRMEGVAHGIGLVYGARKDAAQAYRWFMAELDWNPAYAPAHRDVGMLLLVGFGNEPLALQHLRAAIALDAASAESAAAAGRPATADAASVGTPVERARALACAAAIEVNTTLHDVPAIQVAGQAVPVYDRTLGLRHAREALALAKDDLLVREKCSIALYANDYFDEAIELLRGLARDLPGRADELNFRADLYQKAKEKRLSAPALDGATSPPSEAPSAGGAPAGGTPNAGAAPPPAPSPPAPPSPAPPSPARAPAATAPAATAPASADAPTGGNR